MKIKNQKGYTLLEIILVLAVFFAIMSGVFYYYKIQKQDIQISETEQQINEIMNSSNNILQTVSPDGSEKTEYPISMNILNQSLATPINLR